MNEITRQEIGPNQMANRLSVVESRPYEQVLNEERIGGIFGEALAWLRDDRVNTMRAISSDAASRKMVQKQNHELLTACSTTLQREGPNLTIEQQLSLIDKMRGAAASTERTDAESRAFQREQLSHSHKRSGQLSAFVIAVMLGAGGAAWYLKRAA